MSDAIDQKKGPCWERVPPECPVKVPLNLHAADVSVRVGALEGGDGCARVVSCGVEFEAVGRADFASASKDVVSQLAERLELDLKVGAVVRRIVGRKPVLAKVLKILVQVLTRYAEGEEERETLRGLINTGSP